MLASPILVVSIVREIRRGTWGVMSPVSCEIIFEATRSAAPSVLARHHRLTVT